MKLRHTILVALSAACLLGVSVFAEDIPFDLHAHTYDYGESINRISFSIPGIDPSSLTAETFTVKSTAALPKGIPGDEMNFGVYEDVDRGIDTVGVTGDVVEIFLHCENGGAGEGTLSYSFPNIQKNMDTVLTYVIEQAADIVVNGETVPAGTYTFVQNEGYDNPEVDAFASDVVDEITYYYYVPKNADDGQAHPLILWLHGYGEGGYEGVTATTSGLRANRAAICFAEDRAQEIFGGAFVVAPQAPTSWMEGLIPYGYDQMLLNILDKMASEYAVDTNRIYVCGASSGGYGTTQMTLRYPERFAASVPICPAISSDGYGATAPTDEDLLAMASVPVWTIQAANDPSVEINGGSRRLASVLENIIYTEYATVNIEGVEYNGHWSWIYFEQNMPTYEGQSVWEWMAAQSK